ncbi:hypothetical protein FKM82_019428 [Ascaphus truei]
MCVFRLDISLNPFPHSAHTCGLSPVCVLLCVFRLDTSLNPFPHSAHTCGLSPVCVLLKLNGKCLQGDKGWLKRSTIDSFQPDRNGLLPERDVVLDSKSMIHEVPSGSRIEEGQGRDLDADVLKEDRK